MLERRHSGQSWGFFFVFGGHNSLSLSPCVCVCVYLSLYTRQVDSGFKPWESRDRAHADDRTYSKDSASG